MQPAEDRRNLTNKIREKFKKKNRGGIPWLLNEYCYNGQHTRTHMCLKHPCLVRQCRKRPPRWADTGTRIRLHRLQGKTQLIANPDVRSKTLIVMSLNIKQAIASHNESVWTTTKNDLVKQTLLLSFVFVSQYVCVRFMVMLTVILLARITFGFPP